MSRRKKEKEVTDLLSFLRYYSPVLSVMGVFAALAAYFYNINKNNDILLQHISFLSIIIFMICVWILIYKTPSITLGITFLKTIMFVLVGGVAVWMVINWANLIKIYSHVIYFASGVFVLFIVYSFGYNLIKKHEAVFLGVFATLGVGCIIIINQIPDSYWKAVLLGIILGCVYSLSHSRIFYNNVEKFKDNTLKIKNIIENNNGGEKKVSGTSRSECRIFYSIFS